MPPDADPRPPTRRLALILAWLIAAAFALAALWLLGVAFNLRTANNLLETERDLARVSHRLARSELEERTFLAEKIINELQSRGGNAAGDVANLRVALLEPDPTSAPQARVAVVWDPVRATGLLAATQLPKLQPQEILQLWVESKGVARSVATFEPENSALSAPIALHETKDFDAFRLTIEKTPAPTRPGERTVARGGLR
jgi:hypothetical protein